MKPTSVLLQDPDEMLKFLALAREQGCVVVKVTSDSIEAQMLPLPPALPKYKEVVSEKEETPEEKLDRELFGA